MAERRNTFGPVVLVGLGSAALLAVAGAKPWFRASVDPAVHPGVTLADRQADSPLALALALVVLAGWGALLVTRGGFRRAVVGLAFLAALGSAAAVVAAPSSLPGQVRDQLALPHVSVPPTGWYWVAAVAALLTLGALTLAWRLVPGWPEMGTRYDAPGTAPQAGTVEPADDPRALWKALDEGHDPTDPTAGS